MNLKQFLKNHKKKIKKQKRKILLMMIDKLAIVLAEQELKSIARKSFSSRLV